MIIKNKNAGYKLSSIEYEELRNSDSTCCRKVNLPLDNSQYKSGNGEGCWVFVDKDIAAHLYLNDSKCDKFLGVLDTNSIHYPGLMFGTVVPCENIPGAERPVVNLDWLKNNYNKLESRNNII